MRFLTFAVLACLATSLACAGAAAAPKEPPAGYQKKRAGVPVASPNRKPGSQLAHKGQSSRQEDLVEGPTGAELVDKYGRVVGRAHPGFITHEPLVAARLNKLRTAIAGLAPDMRCDGIRCLYGSGLVWGTNAPVLLLYSSVDCSGDPMVSYHPSVAGFDAIAFAVDDPDGLYIYQARNKPYEAVVGSFRRPASDEGCQRTDTGGSESVLPLETVFPAGVIGVAPMRWR